MNIRNPFKRYYFVTYRIHFSNGNISNIGCGVYSSWSWRNPETEIDHIVACVQQTKSASDNVDIEILSVGVI